MIIGFDKFGIHEIPVLTLSNPNRKELGQLGAAYSINSSFKFNAISDLTFNYPSTIDGINKTQFYDDIVAGRIIKTDTIGVYLIKDVDEVGDGVELYKSVSCVTIEYELIYRKLNLFGDGKTLKFWDITETDGTLLGEIIKILPNWTVGYVSDDLWNKYRTFDISDNTIYNFLMSDVEQSYECIFLFDTYKQTINAYTPEDVVKNSDIFISYENAIKDCDIEEVSEDLVTALACYGSGNLDIAGVNPIGSNTIYNFDYFKPMMTKELRDSIDLWEANILLKKDLYVENLTKYRAENEKLTLAKSQLVDLESDLKALQGVQSAQIEQGITDSSYTDTVNKITEAERLIVEKSAEIKSYEDEIEIYQTELKNINDILSIEKAFSDEQYKELNYFIRENTYQDDSFLSTSEMTPEEIQDMAQALYDQSIVLLDKLASPRYNIDIDSTNLLFQSEYKDVFGNLDVGTSINLLLDEKHTLAVLLEINLEWDNPDVFSMKFANRYRLNDAEWQFSDLYQNNSKATSSIDFKLSGLEDWKGYQDDVTNFVNSALDASLNEIINSSGQEFLLNENGLRLRKLESDGTYNDEQMWLINNQLVFSDSGFRDSVDTAIGKIKLPNGDDGYGVVGEAIVGNILIGNQLHISNSNNSFIVDENGATLRNADLTITRDSGGTIKLNPDDGISITNKDGDKTFNIDTNGNAVLTGSIVANSGTIGGWTIDSTGISSGNNWIKSNGSIRLGQLSIEGSTSNFYGNFYANNVGTPINQNLPILGTHVGTNTITGGSGFGGGNIAYGSITGANIRAGSITADKISTESLAAWLADIEIVRVRTIYASSSIMTDGTLVFTGNASININGRNENPSTEIQVNHQHTVTIDGKTYFTSLSGQHSHIYGRG